jgi:hypothetical protein
MNTRHYNPLVMIVLLLLSLTVAVPLVRSQDLPKSTVAEAARSARERKVKSTKHANAITNSDLEARQSPPTPSQYDLTLSATYQAQDLVLPIENANPPAPCNSPQAAQLAADLQAAQQGLDQLRRELSAQPTVISDNGLDPQYFHPGASGLDVGSPPLQETQPTPPARITEVQLEEQVASLQKSLRLACAPPQAAALQLQLDQVEQSLDLHQRDFALQQDTYYSNPNYSDDTAGKAQLDDASQQIQDLQSQVDQLRQQLAAIKPASAEPVANQ